MEYSLKSWISGAIRIAGFENQNRLKDMREYRQRKKEEKKQETSSRTDDIKN
jgi:hypothetical protein